MSKNENTHNRCLGCEHYTPYRSGEFRYYCDRDEKRKRLIPDGHPCDSYDAVPDSDNHFDTFFPW